MCHSISLVEPAVIKFFPCLNSDAGVIEELTGALRGFRSRAPLNSPAPPPLCSLGH